MLTLFTCPKPFKGHISVIQRNAVKSWTLLRPCPEIILFGDEEGTQEVCREFSVRNVPEIARNEFGTPLLDDIFEKAQRLAAFDGMCYVNADIMLMGDFLEAIQRVRQSLDRFLMFGSRWDIDVDGPWDFDLPDWQQRLREFTIRSRPPGPLWGLADYFVFPKGVWEKIPPFAIGRTAWDNWLIYGARARRLAVVDASESVIAVHQKHDYRHQSHSPESFAKSLMSAETKRNQVISGGREYNDFGVYDATHILTPTGLKRALGLKYFLRALDAAPVLYPALVFLRWLTRFRRLAGRAWAKVFRSAQRQPGRAPKPLVHSRQE